METLPWYKSAIVRQQIVAFLVAAFGLLKFKTDIDIDATVGAILAGIAAIIPIYTIVTRIFKPAPNLSQTAAEKEVELVKEGKIPPSPVARPTKQGGFVTLNMLGHLLAANVCLFIGLAVIQLAGCTSTQAAYKAAPLHGEAVTDTAYVIAEHYSAVLKEAADLRDAGRIPAPLLAAVQEADRRAQRIILGVPAEGINGLRQWSEIYIRLHDAQSQAELQKATDQAAIALSDLIKAVAAAKR